ncbi:YSIRK-type signal peptide-containing protein [Lactobacillus sp. Marseille-P7033]|nr:YSIRK-type signal peptide-containing protein [Lactobacillus sp. Marseille-P7033]
MLSHNNWEEQIKKYEPKKQRFTIKKLSVGVASVLLGVTFAAGTASADSTTANADSASGSDSAEQTDHNLTLNSTSTSTLKSATAASQNNSASTAVQNPAGDVKAQAANDYEAAVSAAVANASSDVASDAVQNSSASSVQSSSAADSSAQASAVKSTATQAFSVRSAAVNNFNYASVFASLAAMQQSNNDNAAAQADTNAADSEYSNYKTVTDWSGLQSAISSGAQGVNIKGTINPGWFSNGNLNINGNFTIHGVDGAVLNLGQNYILNNGQLTLDDITLNGAVLGDGTVNIKGKVNSIVTDAATSGSKDLQGFADATRTSSGAGTGGSADPGANVSYPVSSTNSRVVNGWDQRKVPNFHAANMTIADNATLNIRRTATGDGIVLKDGAVTNGLNFITQSTNNGKLTVGKNATLTINLKNSELSGDQIKSTQKGDKLDNLNAAVRVNTSGSFVTGENAHITMNVGTGRGIVFSERSTSGVASSNDNYVSRGESGANGLNDTGNDKIGPWVQRNSAVKNTFKLGKNSTFTFVGRDAFMLGNRATFNSGEGSVINVHTYGNAIDMGGFSSLNIDPGSTVSFISDGKDAGGDYHTNNYVALGADGKINVLKDATLRVILTGRGASALNDDINIASYGNYDPKIYVGNNATLDVQSDATQGNAELIAIPLPSSNSINFILDNVKYVNLQKTANITATILAPASPDLSSALSKYGYPASRNGYGNLLFMNAGRGQNAHFQAFGDLAAFKWNSALKDNNWTPNLSSNGLQYDPNQSVSKNYQNFENSADQTWSNMYGFDIPYAGFSKTSTGGSVWVDPSGSTAGTNVNSNNGAAFSDLVKGFSPYMSQRLVVIGHSMQPVKEQRTVHYVVQSVDENGNPIETDPTQMREIANPYVQSAQGNNAQSQQLYKDNATDQLVAVERNADGTPKLDANGAVIPIRDSNGNYVSDGDSVNWKNVKGTIVKGSDGHYYFQGYTAPSTISGKDSNGNEVTSLDGGLYKLATAAQLASISNTSQVVKDGKINNSKAFANTQNDFKSGNFYNTYKDGNLYVVYREVNQKANLKIVDSTTGKTLNTYETAGQTDQAINFANGNVNPATDVENYINNGYVFEKAINDADPANALTTKGYSDINFGDFDSDTKTDQSFTVYLKHGLEDVNKDNPHDQKVQATVTRTVKYTVNGQPSNQLQNKTESVDFSATGHWDKVLKQLVDVVDGKILVENGQVKKGSLTWTPKSGTLNGYDAPVLAGYHVDSVSAQQGDKNVTTDNVDSTGAVKNVTVNHTDKDINVTVNLVKNAEEKANLKIVDDTTGKTLDTLDAQGDENTPINFTDGASKVAGYLNKGYKFVNVVSDANGKVLSTTDYDAANFGNYDTDPDSDQSFTVHLKHGYTTIDKNNPNGHTVTASVNRTVNYTVDGKADSTLPGHTETVNFSATGYEDTVTHQLVDVVNGEIVTENNTIKPGSLTRTVDGGTTDSAIMNGYTAPTKDRYHVNYDGITVTGANKSDNVENNGAVKSITVNHESHNIAITIPLVSNGTKLVDQGKTKTTSATVRYIVDGNDANKPQAPADNVQNGFEFTYSGDTYDAYTNKLISKGT